MSSEVIAIKETAQRMVSGHRVAVGDVFHRDLPDAEGEVSTKLSALLMLTAPDGKESKQIVAVGSDVTLGADRYCVVRIDAGTKTPGTLHLQRIVP